MVKKIVRQRLFTPVFLAFLAWMLTCMVVVQADAQTLIERFVNKAAPVENVAEKIIPESELSLADKLLRRAQIFLNGDSRGQVSKTTTPADWNASAEPDVARISVVESTPVESLTTQQSIAEMNTLFDRISDDPQDVSINFRYASLAISNEKYEEAIAAYERILINNPDLPRVRLDLALVLFKVDQKDEARALFESVKAYNPPTEVLTRVNAFIAAIDKSKRKHFWNVGLTAGLGSDSNASSQPSSGAVDVFGVSQPVSSKYADEMKYFGQASLRHTYKYTDALSWNSQVGYYQAMQEDSSSLDIKSLTLQTGPVFTLPNKTVRVGGKVSVSKVELAGSDYASTLSGEVYTDKIISPHLRGRLAYTYEDKTYKNTPTVTTYTDKNGHQHSVRASLTKLFTPQHILNTTAAYGREKTHTDYNSNIFHSVGLTYTHLMDSGYFMNVNAGWKKTSYDGVDILVNSAIIRADDELTYGIALGKKLGQNLSCKIGYSYKDISSNIQNYTYDNHQILGTVSLNY